MTRSRTESLTCGWFRTTFDTERQASHGGYAQRLGHDLHPHITDGPFLVRLDDGPLAMLWSSGSDKGYAVGAAISESGQVVGPWRHQPEPVYDRDGGHAMTFRADGELLIALHQPNTAPSERLTIRRLVIDGSLGRALRSRGRRGCGAGTAG